MTTWPQSTARPGCPTAGGEALYGVKGFYPYVRAEAVDILMPDVKYCGGMFELKKIAALAEAVGAPVSPHGPASPVGNVVAAHVCASMPTFQILEFGFGEVPWRHELIEPAESLVKGRIYPFRPARPRHRTERARIKEVWGGGMTAALTPFPGWDITGPGNPASRYFLNPPARE